MIIQMLEKQEGMRFAKWKIKDGLLSVRRRTGVTVPEGRRDEFGLEEITGIFSSPQKALSTPRDTAIQESTVEVSEEMVGMDSTYWRAGQCDDFNQNTASPRDPFS